jgi:hypothetical protein
MRAALLNADRATLYRRLAGTEEQRAAREKTQNTMFNLKSLIEKRHIFLPAQMCTLLKGHLDSISNHLFGVGSYGAYKALKQA